MKTTITTALRAAADLLFPPRCVHCGAEGSTFCDRCIASSTALQASETCRTCALPSPTSTCEICFRQRPALDRAIAAYTYQPEIRSAIAALKYEDVRSIAPRLADLMVEALPRSLQESVDAIVAVPITAARLRSRGYNQSELLARRISDATGIPVRDDMLTRVGDEPPQARAASIDERAVNVRDAFVASEVSEGHQVLLIDDVMTTGATLNACARALKNAGASRVGALVLAREL